MKSEPAADLAAMPNCRALLPPLLCYCQEKSITLFLGTWIPLAKPGEGVKQGCKQSVQLGNYVSNYLCLGEKPP